MGRKEGRKIGRKEGIKDKKKEEDVRNKKIKRWNKINKKYKK